MDDSGARDSERLKSVVSRPGRLRAISTQPVPSGVPVYEDLLDRDPRWALSEGSQHFEENSAVFKALYNIAEQLKILGIPYAIVGGMALFRHGLRRFTEDVDILVTKDGLKRIHECLDGRGYLPPFTKSKHLRDTVLGVRIEFLTTGDYPGDGKKKPVSFPDPDAVAFEADGIKYITLEKLVELKLASGMTNSGRLKDLADVLELIKVLDLPPDFVNKLDPFVRDKFNDLWNQSRKRFIATLRDHRIATTPEVLEELISEKRGENYIKQLRQDGVTLEVDGDRVRFVTTDPMIAEKYGLVDESDYWPDEDKDA